MECVYENHSRIKDTLPEVSIPLPSIFPSHCLWKRLISFLLFFFFCPALRKSCCSFDAVIVSVVPSAGYGCGRVSVYMPRPVCLIHTPEHSRTPRKAGQGVNIVVLSPLISNERFVD